ncbi:hypothetical protein EDC04DRAFT_2907947 [Pisolithus marmoratus]|nr:hypothetical protein EDC04DRAFT_2907947 [Pisolithus marmoratus]
MGDMEGKLIKYAVEEAPVFLQNELEEDYDSWDKFIEAVRKVKVNKLLRNKEMKKGEQELKNKVQELCIMAMPQPCDSHAPTPLTPSDASLMKSNAYSFSDSSLIMHTQACTHQRETSERLATALANPQQLPSIVQWFQSFSAQHHAQSEPAQDSASQAGHSNCQHVIFHTPPHHCDPGDGSDGGGSGDGGIPKDPAEPPKDPLLVLAWAVHESAHSSRHLGDSTPKTKVHEPDTFDGSDPKKLWEFLVQCELNSQDCLCAFHSDQAKVTFAQSYLEGMALACFEPDLLNPGNLLNWPLWMDNYQEFLRKLTANFSLHDAVADAVQQLENLAMKDTSHVTKYVVEFNCWASQVKDYGNSSVIFGCIARNLAATSDSMIMPGSNWSLVEPVFQHTLSASLPRFPGLF